MSEIHVYPDNRLVFDGAVYRCAIGRGGVTTAKTEGDGATPVGVFPLRRVLYRADRNRAPEARLPVEAIARDDGWCDAPGDPGYNRRVKRPYPASHESMWRADTLYDVVVVLGHNDDPPVPGAGSAILLHVARPDYTPTAGCVALALGDLLKVLKNCGPETRLRVHAVANG
jgi:L,D-peptidoglycan transpeptidase YkuD (ErfK/YbiS/YcfS/YnhG family)